MEPRKNDSANSKERNGLVSYSINGILGLSSETDAIKDHGGQNTAQDQDQVAEGNYRRPSNLTVQERLFLDVEICVLRESSNLIRAGSKTVILCANVTDRCLALLEPQLFYPTSAEFLTSLSWIIQQTFEQEIRPSQKLRFFNLTVFKPRTICKYFSPHVFFLEL